MQSQGETNRVDAIEERLPWTDPVVEVISAEETEAFGPVGATDAGTYS